MTRRRAACVLGLGLGLLAGFGTGSGVRADAIRAGSEPGVLWYGGDYAAGSRAYNTMFDGRFGYAVLDDFVVTDPGGWDVTGLFSNNAQSYTPIPGAPLPAAWSVRTGAGPGDHGQTLAGGVADAAVTPSGRAGEFTITVSGLALHLAPGTYSFQVSPIGRGLDFSVGVSPGLNAVGVPGPTSVLAEGLSIINGQPEGYIQGFIDPHVTASMGVIGVASVPEPGPLSVLGAAGVWAGWRRGGRGRA